jgi:hypothetical protein
MNKLLRILATLGIVALSVGAAIIPAASPALASTNVTYYTAGTSDGLAKISAGGDLSFAAIQGGNGDGSDNTFGWPTVGLYSSAAAADKWVQLSRDMYYI